MRLMILLNRAKSDHLSSGAVSNDDEDEDENEDYTVYECPGLAPVSFLRRRLFIVIKNATG